MRVGLLQLGQTTCTLLACTAASCVTIPPVCAPRCVVVTLVCFLTRLTPSTSTRLVFGRVSSTRPRAPRSLPLRTTTVSPFFTNSPAISEHLRGKRDDLHEPLLTELATDRAEDAGAARVTTVTDEHRGVLVEADVG